MVYSVPQKSLHVLVFPEEAGISASACLTLVGGEVVVFRVKYACLPRQSLGICIPKQSLGMRANRLYVTT